MNSLLRAGLAIALSLIAGTSHANDSAYTKIDFDKCTQISTNEVGGSMKCAGYKGYDVYYSEGDLRTSVHFGPLQPELIEGLFESFSEFNSINTTVEWRVDARGKPVATILRWYIDDPEAVATSNGKSASEVLVISRVAQPDDGLGCVVGYVDARANVDANVMARQIADDEARDFACGYQERFWHGKRGEKSGTDTSYWPEGFPATPVE